MKGIHEINSMPHVGKNKEQEEEAKRSRSYFHNSTSDTPNKKELGSPVPRSGMYSDPLTRTLKHAAVTTQIRDPAKEHKNYHVHTSSGWRSFQLF